MLGEFGLDAAARKIAPLVLTGDRLVPDVFPLRRQVQIACYAAKNVLVRLSGADAPKFEDTETSFAELKQRIASTLACIDSVPADKLDGTEDKSITFSVGKDAIRTMAGFDYLTGWILPSVYFHTVIPYNILRHNGVEGGKGDYLLGAAARA